MKKDEKEEEKVWNVWGWRNLARQLLPGAKGVGRP